MPDHMADHADHEEDHDEPIPGTSLEGLAKSWESDDTFRGRLLATGNVLQWPSSKLTGVISFETISLNCKVLEKTLRCWCPQVSSAKTVCIDQVREEAREFKMVWAGFKTIFEIKCFFTTSFTGRPKYKLKSLTVLTLQVAQLYKIVSMPVDTVKVNCAAVSIKSFVSYLVRRHNGAKRREPCHFWREVKRGQFGFGCCVIFVFTFCVFAIQSQI